MKKEKFQMKVAVHLILFKDSEILLLRRFNTGWMDGYYSVIAGHVDDGETIAQAMIREAKEEGGLDILESDLKIIHAIHRINASGTEYIDYFLTTEVWSGEPKIMEPDKCDELAWYPLDNLPENTIPYIRSAIEKIRAGVAFSEFNERKYF